MPIVRVAVAGATGNIGALTATALERAGHHVIRVSRSLGVVAEKSDVVRDGSGTSYYNGPVTIGT
ncbi:hypothetical protein ACWDTT_37350, partial [Streptosporangium sandarakinum]